MRRAGGRKQIAPIRARAHLVDRRCAEKTLKHDDHLRHKWVKTLYHVDIDESRLFPVVLDASRFSTDRLVETLLMAGGVAALEPVAG